MAKELKKSSNKMISGVAAGIANYFDLDPTIVRLLFVLVTLLGGSGVLIYLVCWLIMPNR
ncbi:MAG: PspC domain-containing protein [Paludibacteraceae bacterium]|nr:PspC domain-containing protein [Paludibacteraceae bacterium]